MISASSTNTFMKGFTIVELLIVVVVIGILSSITVVAYNGITDRAKTAKLVAAVRESANILSIYKLTYGQFPEIAGNSACLGTNFAASSPYGVSDCAMYGATPASYTDINDYNTLMTEMK